MASSVDLPQPEGPEIERYSPLWTSKWMPAERVRLHLVGHEDLAHLVQLNQRLRAIVHVRFLFTQVVKLFQSYSSLIRS